MTDQEHKTSRRATIMRGVVTPIFGLLAVACFVFGILNATEWKPTAQVNASASADTRYVVTDPGVLALADGASTVTVTSSAADRKLCVVSGLPHDITGWVAGHPYTRLTGLASWSELSVTQAKATGTPDAPADAVSLEQSDMWQSVDCGTGTVSIERPADAASTELLFDSNADAAADDDTGAALTVSMSWTRAKLPDYATPLYFVGGLLTIAAVLSASLFAVHPSKRRKKGSASGTEVARVEEEITVTIPHLVAGIAGSAVNSAAVALHLAKPKRRRHARRAAGGTGGAESAASVPQPKVVDVTDRNMVAQTAAAAKGAQDAQPSQDARPVPEVTLGPVQSSPDGGADADRAAAQDAEPTSVISMDELNAYIARLNAENAGKDGKGEGGSR
ncbi:hypothetical protein G1C96_1698 [Bifidobacterium sp. DSM 109958]|uniref:Asp-tRNAAsn/Glu-tRNAGln amidotransferase A subunit n=1 Tax=Bifidobacterium moraviense TaxID=2675323 RepID=A0A7Y0F311_9BIFI|nr:hypothetical protein [Bifidobacterium sp. DSM 109958]NMN01115.1 hypothetical protein [Bifidobacterium sp. DSM 109958]